MQARAATLAGVILVLGCSSEEFLPTEPFPPRTGVQGISITPASASLAIGAQITFTAVVSGPLCPPTCGVAWSSSNVSVAVVSDSGVVTARAPGSVIIIATAKGDGNWKAGAQVTVTP
ncbi:MAG: Ig-like domain-containing protein [Gemmatimonadota bacterium]